MYLTLTGVFRLNVY